MRRADVAVRNFRFGSPRRLPPGRIGRHWFTLGGGCLRGWFAIGLTPGGASPALQIREDSYGTQNLSYDIGIRYRGADESA